MARSSALWALEPSILHISLIQRRYKRSLLASTLLRQRMVFPFHVLLRYRLQWHIKAPLYYNTWHVPLLIWQSRLDKVLMINRYTGIETRSAIGTIDHPIANQPTAPSIAELCEIFLQEGVALSVAACRQAIKEWGGDVEQITHVVSTTCTNSANPGYDHFVAKGLGLKSSVQKVLLHGIGCSGGLAALRTAANLALGSSFRGKPARVLVMACEISSVLVRSELDSISKNGEVRIGCCLFSDCASAVVLSNGIGDDAGGKGIYELVDWKHDVLPGSEYDLGFDVDPVGMAALFSFL